MPRVNDNTTDNFEREVLDTNVKKIHPSGQITLGKEFAGQFIQIEKLATGQILLTPVDVIPKHHDTFYTKEAKQQLAEYNEFEKAHKPKRTSMNSLRKKVAAKRNG